MANFWAVTQQVAILFLLMGVGAVARRLRIVRPEGVDSLVNLLVLVVTPCVIVNSFLRPFDASMLAGLATAFAVVTFGIVLAIVLSRFLVRHPADDTCRVLRLAVVFSNAGFMGIPLEQAILGPEGVFFGSAYIVVFNLFMWTWGVRTMQRPDGAGWTRRGWKLWINPGTVGIGIGLPLFLLSVPVHESLAVPVRHLANLNTPLAMVIIGYGLAGARLGKVIQMPVAYLATFLRLVAYPLMMVGVLWLIRAHVNRTMALAVVIAASAPVAAMVSMFAVKFNRDVDTSVALVSGTTLMSILTMPPVIALAMAML